MVTLLAHEWIARTGGSENVFEQIRAAYPAARSVCLWSDDPARFPQVEESWLSRTPLRRSKALALPFMNLAWRRQSLADVDRVIVSSHAFAHHLAARAGREGIPSFCYVHSPARYIWAPDLDQRGQHALARLGRRPFQWFDRRQAHPSVHYAANSRFVAARIQDSWGMPATVIYPPVDVDKVRHSLAHATFSASEQEILDRLPSDFVLGASRFVPYKRMESAIEVGTALDLPVVLAGSGPDEPRVRQLAANAKVPVTFVGRVGDELLHTLYSRASLFVFMPVEDFGIMPVEAAAAGTPVLVNSTGGAAESVEILRSGRAADPLSPAEMAAAAEEAIRVDVSAAQAPVDDFSLTAFRDNLLSWAGNR